MAEVVDAVIDSRSVIDMSHEEVKQIFQGGSDCSFDLPPYFKFQEILSEVYKTSSGKKLSEFKQGSPREFDDVNYKVLNQRWPIRLATNSINSPCSYVSLVHNLYHGYELEINLR